MQQLGGGVGGARPRAGGGFAPGARLRDPPAAGGGGLPLLLHAEEETHEARHREAADVVFPEVSIGKGHGPFLPGIRRIPRDIGVGVELALQTQDLLGCEVFVEDPPGVLQDVRQESVEAGFCVRSPRRLCCRRGHLLRVHGPGSGREGVAAVERPSIARASPVQ